MINCCVPSVLGGICFIFAGFGFAKEVRQQQQVKAECMAAAMREVPELLMSGDRLLRSNPSLLRSVRQTIQLNTLA